MANRAIIAHEGQPGWREQRLGRVLDFFGVPWTSLEAGEWQSSNSSGEQGAVFGSIRVVASILQGFQLGSRPRAPVFYAYFDDERDACIRAIESLLNTGSCSLQEPPAEKLPISISDRLSDLAGPMAGLKFSARLTADDPLLGLPGGGPGYDVIITAGNAPVFVRLEYGGASVFLCSSSRMVDLQEPLTRGFYDVKEHFCCAVPLVMFVRSEFREVAWQPQEHSACLIIDDPLLNLRYGFCDFPKLRDLMREYRFTTNIAFIPWNCRRTSSVGAQFFRNESHHFSVSIHGCDHTAGEFGANSVQFLHSTARLAQSRMRDHEQQTGIHHDPIMVFPQGVFSSICPGVLKYNGFLAAVNTEVVPVDTSNAQTRIGDAWDVAITSYSDFPIFTRRYALHGLENFAFDLLLGKPCLIVAHHDAFRDSGANLLDLIQGINSLNCSVRWRLLGEVVRRSCRRRTRPDTLEIHMYASELTVNNDADLPMNVEIRKKEMLKDAVCGISCEEAPVAWDFRTNHLVFTEKVPAHAEKRFKVNYHQPAIADSARRSFGFTLSVASRRFFSEFRDNCIAKSPLLTTVAQRMKSRLRSAI
jgi:hypothetical protein